MKPILKFAILILLFSNFQLASGQDKNSHLINEKSSSLANLKSWKSAYTTAVLNKDTATIFENARKLMVYHNDSGIQDSAYIYNDLVINVALAVGKHSAYVQAQRINYFLDSKMYQNVEKAHKRVLDLQPLLKNNLVKDEFKFSISQIMAGHFYRNGNLDSTLYYQKLTLEYSEAVGKDHNEKAAAHIQMAIYLEQGGRSADAIQYLTDIEEFIESVSIPPMQKIYFYKTFCNSLLAIGEHDIASQYLAKVQSIINKNGYKSFNTFIHQTLGRISSAKGNSKIAISHFQSALASLKSSPIKAFRSTIWANIADEYHKLNDLKHMKQYKDSLFNNFNNLEERNKAHFHEINVLYHLDKGNIKKAKKSLDYINAFNNKPTYERLSIANLNYLYHQKTGNATKELQAYKKYIFLKDSLNQVDNAVRAKHLEAEYNREKQNIEIQALTQTTTAQDRALAVRNTALILGSIMLLILAGLLYSLFKLYKQNQAQTVKITKALKDNQMLIKEIHHRVKNNLQVISSLLSMQARKIDDGDIKEVLNSSMSRVQSMSILHQNLYSGANPKDVEVDKYFDNLMESILATYDVDKQVNLKVDIDPLAFDIDTMVPLGLIANELITNALKYAFAGRESGNLNVSLKENNDQIILQVKDDGIGFEGTELPSRAGSLGARLINSFVKKLKGNLQITHEHGTEMTIIFDKGRLNSVAES